MTDAASHIIDISTAESVPPITLNQFYNHEHIQKVLDNTLQLINNHSVLPPYFIELNREIWHQKPKQLSIYLTDMTEGRELNLEARGKDYATNILSYPSDLPAFVLNEMADIPLGELVICHDVVEKQANEQDKTVQNHVTHLLVHGILHLLGYDHELGEPQQIEMEGFEIEVLKSFGIKNPYITE